VQIILLTSINIPYLLAFRQAARTSVIIISFFLASPVFCQSRTDFT